MASSEKCTIIVVDKILSREVVVETTADGKESMKITVKAPTLGGGRPKPKLSRRWQSNLKLHNWLDQFTLPVRLVQPGDAQPHWSDRFSQGDNKEPSSQRLQRRGDRSQTKETLSIRNSELSQLLISY
jgi:hypothetical protein